MPGRGERGNAAFVSWLHLLWRMRSRAGSCEMPDNRALREGGRVKDNDRRLQILQILNV